MIDFTMLFEEEVEEDAQQRMNGAWRALGGCVFAYHNDQQAGPRLYLTGSKPAFRRFLYDVMLNEHQVQVTQIDACEPES